MSQSKSKREAPCPAEKQKKEPLAVKNRMEDVPPEVLTIILDFATTELDTHRNSVLGIRQVSRVWKVIIDPLIQKRISCAHSAVFPGIKTWGDGSECQVIYVCSAPERFPGGQIKFPFGSLLLGANVTGLTSDANCHPHTPLTLPAFTSKVGGNLTTFALCDQVIPIKILVRMLESMPKLKRISLEEVRPLPYSVQPGFDIPTPPPLLNLTTVQVKSALVDRSSNGTEVLIENSIYVWLIAFYAAQLERLLIQTGEPFPPLWEMEQYYHLFSIAIAFHNLKHLQLVSPTKRFLELSQLPALQHLSISGDGRDDMCAFNLEHLLTFVRNCGKNLKSLSLTGVEGATNVLPPTSRRWTKNGKLVPILREAVVAPKLRTLTFPYPNSDEQENILGEELLRMFPSLELLQLIRYEPSEYDQVPADDQTEKAVYQDDNKTRNGKEIVELKNQLPSLWQQMFVKNTSKRRKTGRRPGNSRDRKTDAALVCLMKQRVAIFNRLDALGEKKERLIVEQLLERNGFWKSCANLKIVSVSSGDKTDGDICVIRRNHP